jgi:hypothetical protein
MRPVFPGGVKAPAPLSLEADLDRYGMHEKELVCAAALRLSCNDYLINKRLIMAAKREHVRDNNKSFLKTHAQQAGCIDVNKASRLWECFEKVGWFRPEFFFDSLARERTSA